MRTIIMILGIIIPITMADGEDRRESKLVIKPALTTEEIIISVLDSAGISSEIQATILAQAKFESGNFTNKLSTKFSNPFAMKHPSRRRTTSLGKLGVAEKCKCFASYTDIKSATLDYLYYLEMIKAPKDTTMTAYLNYLKKKGYFQEDLNVYKRGVKQWYNN
jgi:hypothetical protein